MFRWLVCFMFLPGISTYAQDYLSRSKDEILDEIKSYLTKDYQISSTQSTVYIHSNNTLSNFDSVPKLTVKISGYENIEMQYFFGNADESCDSIVIKYGCNKCASIHINGK